MQAKLAPVAAGALKAAIGDTPKGPLVAGSDARANFEKIIASSKAQLTGRFLSLYDSTDSWMGSCREAFDDSPRLKTREIVLQSGLQPGMGHSLFYAPTRIWIDPAIHWVTE